MRAKLGGVSLVLHSALALTLLAATAVAENFWEKRPFPDWSQEDVLELLTKSPWASSVNLSVGSSAGRRSGGGVGRGGTGGGGMGEVARVAVAWDEAVAGTVRVVELIHEDDDPLVHRAPSKTGLVQGLP